MTSATRYATAIVLALSLGLAGCGESGSGTTAASEQQDVAAESADAAEEPEALDESDVVDTSGESSISSAYLDVSSVDFASPDVVIGYNDYSAMDELAKKIQNLTALEQVVEIEGEIGPSITSHSIMVPNASGSQRIGTTFEVIGFEQGDYPGDGIRVHLVGVVRANDDGIGVIVVPQDQFVRVEEGDTTVALSDATVVVPEDWTIAKDDSPTQLIIESGRSRIEFWCGSARANRIREAADLQIKVNKVNYVGYAESDTDFELATGTLAISAANIYQDDLERFLEYQVVI